MSGQPIRDRNGVAIARDEITRVTVPMCRACNGELDRRFEKKANATIRAIFEREGDAVIAAPDAEAAALRFVKTWLLLAHPKARFSEPLEENLALDERDGGGVTQGVQRPHCSEHPSFRRCRRQ
jgi:hypothetical protein